MNQGQLKSKLKRKSHLRQIRFYFTSSLFLILHIFLSGSSPSDTEEGLQISVRKSNINSDMSSYASEYSFETQECSSSILVDPIITTGIDEIGINMWESVAQLKFHPFFRKGKISGLKMDQLSISTTINLFENANFDLESPRAIEINSCYRKSENPAVCEISEELASRITLNTSFDEWVQDLPIQLSKSDSKRKKSHPLIKKESILILIDNIPFQLTLHYKVELLYNRKEISGKIQVSHSLTPLEETSATPEFVKKIKKHNSFTFKSSWAQRLLASVSDSDSVSPDGSIGSPSSLSQYCAGSY